jgi:hypothetical protein
VGLKAIGPVIMDDAVTRQMSSPTPSLFFSREDSFFYLTEVVNYEIIVLF